MYLAVLAFLLVFILYFLYQEEINYYLEYSAAKAMESASSSGGSAIINYYKYHMM
jgi:hypothetical protein